MEHQELHLLETLGSYVPTLLEMYINTNKHFNLNEFSENELATFFHEWIHFIQDLTTSFGCNNAYVYFERLMALGNKAVSENKEIEPPVRIDNSQNVYTNICLLNLGWGTRPRNDFNHVVGCKNIIKQIPQEYVVKNGPKEYACCILTTDQGETFELGALQIMESMAFLCQSFLFPQTEPNHPVHPYYVAMQVAELYSPEFASSKLNVIALCDISLMSSVPGAQFTSYLARIRNHDIALPKSSEEIYDYFYGQNNLLDSYKMINNAACHHFKGVLKDPKAFKNFREWIDNAFGTALNLRMQTPYFILDILKGGALYENTKFLELYKSIGTPLIKNNKEQYYRSIPTNSDLGWSVEFMQPIKHIMDILSGGDYQCPMISWCLSSGEELKKEGVDKRLIVDIDERCFLNPSLRSLDKIRCPFGFVWYATGLPLLRSKP